MILLVRTKTNTSAGLTVHTKKLGVTTRTPELPGGASCLRGSSRDLCSKRWMDESDRPKLKISCCAWRPFRVICLTSPAATKTARATGSEGLMGYHARDERAAKPIIAPLQMMGIESICTRLIVSSGEPTVFRNGVLCRVVAERYSLMHGGTRHDIAAAHSIH